MGKREEEGTVVGDGWMVRRIDRLRVYEGIVKESLMKKKIKENSKKEYNQKRKRLQPS